MPNVLYVEGYALDRFAEGLWALQPVNQNRVCFLCVPFNLQYCVTVCVMSYSQPNKGGKTQCDKVLSDYFPDQCYAIMYWTCDVKQVGLVLDAGLEEELRIRHLQVADAVRASLGLPVVEYIVTDTPLEVPIFILAVICSKM